MFRTMSTNVAPLNAAGAAAAALLPREEDTNGPSIGLKFPTPEKEE